MKILIAIVLILVGVAAAMYIFTKIRNAGQASGEAPAAKVEPKETPAAPQAAPKAPESVTVTTQAPKGSLVQVRTADAGINVSVSLSDAEMEQCRKDLIVHPVETWADRDGTSGLISGDMYGKYLKGLLPHDVMVRMRDVLTAAGIDCPDMVDFYAHRTLYQNGAPDSPQVDVSSPSREEIARMVDKAATDAEAGAVPPQVPGEDFQPSAAPARPLPDMFVPVK